MLRFNIRVNHGDDNVTTMYYFVHKDYETLSEEEQRKAFDDAVHELNRVYKTYGRLATETGIARLFATFGFERSLP